MAREYPDRVHSLTLASSFCRFEGYTDKIAFKERIRRDFENIKADYNEFLESECIRMSEVPKYMQNAKDGMLFSTEDILSGIHTPTLIMVGKKDLVIDPKESKLLHERITDSKYYEIPTAGHAINITHPRKFNQIVRQFWEELEEK
jgi:pimeloyl-ACP methyl ester carboxylesterase